MTKAERIRLGEIDTAIEDGKELAKKELLPLILEAKTREEEERKLKEEAKARVEVERKLKEEAKFKEQEANKLLKTAIIQFQNLGMDLDKIASLLNKSVEKIEQIIEN